MLANGAVEVWPAVLNLSYPETQGRDAKLPRAIAP